MGDLVYFPLRRMCVLGVPGSVVAAVRAEMPFVAISTDGGALERCDLLVIDENDRGAPDLTNWLRQRMPRFPVVIWNGAVHSAGELIEACRGHLFPAA